VKAVFEKDRQQRATPIRGFSGKKAKQKYKSGRAQKRKERQQHEKNDEKKQTPNFGIGEQALGGKKRGKKQFGQNKPKVGSV